METLIEKVKARPFLFGGIAAALIAVIVLVTSCYSYTNNVRNTGIEKEQQLTAQYLDNQNYLSAYISGFHEQVSVAQAQSAVLDEILLDAVKGRYDEGGFDVDSALFAAVVEAYPEASAQTLLSNWGKIQDYIASQREGYRNQQSKLLDILRSYDSWRKTGFVKNFVAGSVLGFPSENLEARVGDTVLRGPAARDKMYQIVLTRDAIKAYETGEMDPLEVPPSGTKP